MLELAESTGFESEPAVAVDMGFGLAVMPAKMIGDDTADCC